MSQRIIDAADRNKEPIFDVLSKYMPKAGFVLEIASGTGQHAAYFAPSFPGVTWQPTDCDDSYLKSEEKINCLQLGVTLLSSFEELHKGMFRAAGVVLKPGGLLFIYGPFKINGVLAPESNVNFDKWLRDQDSSYGVRDVFDLDALAKENGLKRTAMVDMPSNNKSLIYEKES